MVTGPLSALVDVFANQYPVAWAFPPVQWYWGGQIHLASNYLKDEATEVRGRLVGRIGTCYQSMPQ
jgi:hypothetical protein